MARIICLIFLFIVDVLIIWLQNELVDLWGRLVLVTGDFTHNLFAVQGVIKINYLLLNLSTFKPTNNSIFLQTAKFTEPVTLDFLDAELENEVKVEVREIELIYKFTSDVAVLTPFFFLLF